MEIRENHASHINIIKKIYAPESDPRKRKRKSKSEEDEPPPKRSRLGADYDNGKNYTDEHENLNDKPYDRIVLNLINEPSIHILYSKGKLMKNANYIHFLSKDCTIFDPISKELASKNPKNLQELKPGIGNFIYTKTDLGTIIFTLFVKEKHNSLARLKDVTLFKI